MKTKLFYLVCIIAIVSFTASVSAQTAGTLTFSYNQPQPTSPAPNSGIKNVLAVWIENSAGTFIKTKYRFVSTSTKDHLPTWAAKSGGVLSNATTATCNTTDATTGATCTSTATTSGVSPSGATRPTAFGSKTVTWDGKNVVGTTNGTTVADGNYKIWVESSWVDSGSNNHNEIISFTFTKGPTGVHLTPTGDTYINTVVIDWVPAPLSVDDVNKEPVVVIYPVPSTGIFNLDMRNELKSIKVYDLLGQTVYSEDNLQNTFTTTKSINLSGVANGNYIISLTNDNGTSNFEVIVNR
jgi:hypothetical protein